MKISDLFLHNDFIRLTLLHFLDFLFTYTARDNPFFFLRRMGTVFS
jgi:hypothetical protein